MLSCLNGLQIDKLFEFYRMELTKEIACDNFKQLVELSLIFLGGDTENKFKMQIPSLIYHTRWMAREIDLSTISFFSSQFSISKKD